MWLAAVIAVKSDSYLTYLLYVNGPLGKTKKKKIIEERERGGGGGRKTSFFHLPPRPVAPGNFMHHSHR